MEYCFNMTLNSSPALKLCDQQHGHNCHMEMVQSFVRHCREHDTVTGAVPYTICV
jgi:hypothetical protein